MSRETKGLLTLEQARELFPEDPPSTRWISKMAKLVGCYIKAGRRVYITSDLPERIREWHDGPGAEKARKAPITSACGFRSEKPARSSASGLNTALELIDGLKQKR